MTKAEIEYLDGYLSSLEELRNIMQYWTESRLEFRDQSALVVWHTRKLQIAIEELIKKGEMK